MKTKIILLTWMLLPAAFLHAQDLPYTSGSTGADGAFVAPNLPAGFNRTFYFDAAFDPVDGVIRHMGGIYYPNAPGSFISVDVRRQTSEWDGTNWTTSATQAPVATVRDMAMAYDIKNSMTVAYGGRASTGSSVSNDTLTWDGANWVVANATSSPGPLGIHQMAYDEAAEEIIMFGGFNAVAAVNATWAWVASNNNWVAKSPSTPPPARYDHKMCWDGAREEIVLFGGWDGNYLGDTWVYSAGEWMQKFPTNSPSPRYEHAMSYDPVSEYVVLHGGVTAGPDRKVANDETWLWDGTNWMQVATTPTLSGRYAHEMVTDTNNDIVYLMGGFSYRKSVENDLWKWDAATTNWLQVAGDAYIIDMNEKPDGVWNFTSINIPAGQAIAFEPNSNNTPVVWLATDDVVIDGVISVDGEIGVGANNPLDRSRGGPGGFAGGLGGNRVEIYNSTSGTPGEGPGGGGPGISNRQSGGFGTYQGIYGNEYIIPLLGGSGGGGAASYDVSNGRNGGGGGGVILIASSRDITVNGTIHANGGIGFRHSNTPTLSGNGSGGAVKLVADRIHGVGAIEAKNGGGGTTANSGGYVRLESYLRPFDISGTVTAGNRSNAAPLIGVNYGLVPSLVVSQVDGVGVTAPPTGAFISPDVVFTGTGNVDITITATNIPDGTPVTVKIYHSAGVIDLPAQNLSAGSATFSETIPQGLGTIKAFATYDVNP